MADKQGTPLIDIDGFPEEAANKLAEAWITTAEELVSSLRQEDGPAGMAKYLEIAVEEVMTIGNLAAAALPPGVEFGPEEAIDRGLGAMDEGEDFDDQDEPVAFGGPLPPSVSLIDDLPAVRDQGHRGTCVAHACVGVREHLIGVGGTDSDLSEQFVYWACKQRDGYTGSGTWIKHGMAVLQEMGVCLEMIWPYNMKPIPGNESQGPPPVDAQQEASGNRTESSKRLNPNKARALREVLANGHAIAFAVPVFDYWFRQPLVSTGDIRMKLPHDIKKGGHAMILVGYQDDPSTPGGGYFLLRNSWGTDWASDSSLGAGYARLPYAYMEQFGMSAFTAFVSGVSPVQPIVRVSLLDRLKRLLGLS